MEHSLIIKRRQYFRGHMQNFVVVDRTDHWRFNVDNVKVISSKDYLMSAVYSDMKQIRFLNLCQSYKYQCLGYYVSLLAEARGHRVFPSVKTIQDLRSQTIVRAISDDLDQLIQKSLAKIKSVEFDLSIYFGKNVAKQHEKLALRLYNLFESPLLRIKFVFNKKWLLQSVSTIALKDVPEHHCEDLVIFANQYLARAHYKKRKKNQPLYDLAILYNPNEKFSPSNQKAIKQFLKVADKVGFRPQLIGRSDFNKISFFDALFIRETTSVNHYTYRFARRAASEGLVVVDDPASIIQCANKVYLAEIFSKTKLSRPKTCIIHKENKHIINSELGFPCILKLPDGSFSQSVVKVEDDAHLKETLNQYFLRSDLLIAQAFMPTDFDWRIGVLNREPIFACKYYMVKKHWQIYKWNQPNQLYAGEAEAVPISKVPDFVLKTALKGANLIGDGFYGIDLKEINHKAYLIELNDNPNVDDGVEDEILGEELYFNIMRYFVDKLDKKKLRQ